jgi:hypothetical protein
MRENGAAMSLTRSIVTAIGAAAIGVGICLSERIAWGADGGQAVQGSERFAGKLLASTPRGKTVVANVDLRVWNVSDHQLTILPVSGFYIANAISGQLTTVMNGKSEAHSPGDFWTVPNGMPMSVAANGESATLQTIAVRATGSSLARPHR